MFGNPQCPLCKGTGKTEKGFLCAWMEIPRVRNTFKALFIILMLLVASISVKAQTATTKTKCTANTVKGIQCKNYAIANQTYCSIHSTAAIQCGTATTKGQPCKLRVKVKGDKCWRHQ